MAFPQAETRSTILPLVGVIMGSASDEEAVQPTINILESLGVDYEVRVISAHRTPERGPRVRIDGAGAGDRSNHRCRRRFRGVGRGIGSADHITRDRHPVDFKRAQRMGCPAVNGANAARHTGGGDGSRRMGRKKRRVLCRPDPRHQARRYPRSRGAVSAVSS